MSYNEIMPPQRILIPEGEWVDRLRRGNMIWLVKEERLSQVEWPWIPPEPGHIAGKLALDLNGQIQDWYVRNNGLGLDNKPLIQPIEGNLEDNPPPVDEPAIQQIHRELERINRRLSLLENPYIPADPEFGKSLLESLGNVQIPIPQHADLEEFAAGDNGDPDNETIRRILSDRMRDEELGD